MKKNEIVLFETADKEVSLQMQMQDALITSPDFVLMPECPGMTDEEAAEVVKDWCVKNDIPYNDDMDNIEMTYRWYYKYDK